MNTMLEQDAAATIRTLAERHHVTYAETPLDVLGHHITRLSGDDVTPDETQLLLLALQRAGHLSGREAVHLHVKYLRQSRR